MSDDASSQPQYEFHDSYLTRSKRPLQGLFFLLPMIVLYELGTLVYATDPARGVTRFIYARSLLRDFFEWLGMTGYYLPGLIVVVVLFSWHMVQRDPWRFEPRLYIWMWIESALLALPLFVFAIMVFRQSEAQLAVPLFDVTAVAPLAETTTTTAPTATDGWQAMLVFSIGAGIYEELLFRLIGIALLHMILVDVIALPEKLGAVIVIGLSALAFALYHFTDQNPFAWNKCIFYTGAGVYFAAVYVLRGFGIVAGTHAVYDLIVVGLQLSQTADT